MLAFNFFTYQVNWHSSQIREAEKPKEDAAKIDPSKNTRKTVKELANRIKDNVHAGSAPAKKGVY